MKLRSDARLKERKKDRKRENKSQIQWQTTPERLVLTEILKGNKLIKVRETANLEAIEVTSKQERDVKVTQANKKHRSKQPRGNYNLFIGNWLEDSFDLQKLCALG